MRRQQETTRAAGRITDGLARLGSHHLHHGRNERTRREILARAAFHVLGVLLQQPLIGVALHIGGQAGPLLRVNQVHDQSAQQGRVLDFVLRPAKNEAQHPRHLAQFLQRLAIMDFQRVAILGQQCGPVVSLGDSGSGVPPLSLTQIRRVRLLIRHFQEQQKR